MYIPIVIDTNISHLHCNNVIQIELRLVLSNVLKTDCSHVTVLASPESMIGVFKVQRINCPDKVKSI